MPLDKRPLQLKIRVLARPGKITSEQDLLDILEMAWLTETVPEGVRILWIDWKKGEGGEANEGKITADLAKEIRAFWHAISGKTTTTDFKAVPPAPRKSRKAPRKKGKRPRGGKGRRRPRR